MKRYWRRLRWLILLGGFCAACAQVSPLLPRGHVVDKSGLVDAQVLIWRTAYQRTDAAPLVYVVEGADLTCTTDDNDRPGFECPTVGCRQGCTGTPFAVSLVPRQPWSQSVLAHELMHVLKIRKAIEVLRYSPATAILQQLADRDHQGPEWIPGGDVDRANALLVEHGQ